MAKKFIKRALSVGLSLVLCGSMVVPSLAASFADLQGAISAKNDSNEFTADDGTTRYGYGKGEGSKWEIEAWGEKNDRNVKLNENVTYGGTDPEPSESRDIAGIKISNGQNVNLDLNGKTIDGGYRAEIKNEQDEVTQAASAGSGQSVINVQKATVKISNGTITGGYHTWPNGGGIESIESSLTLEDVNVVGNKSAFGGGLFIQDGSFTMTRGKISNNEATNNGGGIYTKGVNGRVSVTMTDVVVSGNNGAGYAGGIRTWRTDMTLNNVIVDNNYAKYEAGGILVSSSSKITMNGGSITNNRVIADGSFGGGVDIDCLNDSLELTGVKVTGNTSAGFGGGIYVYKPYDGRFQNTLILNAGNEIHSNTSSGVGSDIYANAGTKVVGLGTALKAPVGQKFDGWYENDESGRSEESYKYEGEDNSEMIVTAVNLVASMTPVTETPEPEPTETPASGIDIEDPDVPLGEEPDDEVEIEDPEVPLAGPFTRADAIGYLWEQTGSPDAELSDFPDVPEDHYWAVAIGWAQDMGIALPDEEGNFRPDDLVLRSSSEPEGELQQFLNRYAVFAGAAEQGETFIQLTGASDDVIMGEEAQVIFDDFFAKLEAALAEQAA